MEPLIERVFLDPHHFNLRFPQEVLQEVCRSRFRPNSAMLLFTDLSQVFLASFPTLSTSIVVQAGTKLV